MIIAGDLNEAINAKLIELFYVENSIFDIYHYINKIEN